MSFARIVEEVVALFGDDGMYFSTARIHMAVDVVGYPVAFFRDTVTVARKRSGAEWGTLQYQRITAGGAETLVFGRRPNVVRIYDKNVQQATLTRRARDPRIQGEPCTQLSVAAADGPPWTRVERQYGRAGIPKELETLRTIRDSASEINPFELIRFHHPAASSDLPLLTGPKYARYLGLRAIIDRDGMQGAIRQFNRRSPGKGRRQINSILKDANTGEDFPFPNLQALYQASLERQLAT
jgi:hypothetical protein